MMSVAYSAPVLSLRLWCKLPQLLLQLLGTAPKDTTDVSKNVVLYLFVRICVMLGSMVRLFYCAHGTEKQTRSYEMWIAIEILSSLPKLIKQLEYSKPLLVSVSHCLRHSVNTCNLPGGCLTAVDVLRYIAELLLGFFCQVALAELPNHLNHPLVIVLELRLKAKPAQN